MPSVDVRTRNDSCSLVNYGIGEGLVSDIFRTIVKWMRGDGLPWNQTRYINVFAGPDGRKVVELLFFHYDGPPEREIGGGGEFNYCKLYLYDDHIAVNFVGENDDSYCGLTFKYSVRWSSAEHEVLEFVAEYLSEHLNKVFDSEPRRFDGTDREVEAIKDIYSITKSVMTGHIII
jgi:hypothetical protein